MKTRALSAFALLGPLLAACGGAATQSTDLGSSKAAVSDSANQTAFDFFLGKGLTPVQAAGIVGNLDQESSMDPTVAESGGGPGRGIAQWSVGGRWDTETDDNVQWYAAQQGESADSLTLQLGFIWYELTTFSGYGLASLRGATSVTSATVAFETDFEGCGECDQSTRVSYAEAALAAYGDDTVTGTSGGSGSTGSTDAGSAGVGSCYSTTLGKTVPANSCVDTDASGDGVQCDDGAWVNRYDDPTPCAATYPYNNGGHSGGGGAGCYSDTLGATEPDNACVQSAGSEAWYQCDNGSWVDRWTDPTACNGTFPL